MKTGAEAVLAVIDADHRTIWYIVSKRSWVQTPIWSFCAATTYLPHLKFLVMEGRLQWPLAPIFNIGVRMFGQRGARVYKPRANYILRTE